MEIALLLFRYMMLLLSQRHLPLRYLYKANGDRNVN